MTRLPTAPRLARRSRAVARRSRERVVAAPGRNAGPARRLREAPLRRTSSSRRGGAGLPPGHARPAAVRADDARPRGAHRRLPRRRDHRHPPRQERELPVRAHAEHLQHGPPLRPRIRGADGVRVAAAGRLRRPRGQARPTLPPATPAHRGRRAARRRARRRAACPRGPARAGGRSARDSSLPRRRTCGS